MKNLLKDMINNTFVLLYERHITETQKLINDTYEKAHLLVPPDETFEIAAHRVITKSYPSFLDIANEKTAEIIFDCDLLFDNADKLKMALEASKATEAVGALGRPTAKAIAKSLKSWTLLFDAFKLANYGTACSLGFDRYSDNRKEQNRVPALSFNPSIVFSKTINQYRNAFAAFRNQTTFYQREQSILSLTNIIDQTTIYNNKVDSVALLIQNNQNNAALLKANELLNIK